MRASVKALREESWKTVRNSKGGVGRERGEGGGRAPSVLAGEGVRILLQKQWEDNGGLLAEWCDLEP